MKIKDLVASEILDSRGNPTVKVKLILEDDRYVIAKVPSGASTGSKEALELRDNNPKRYLGLGVLKAVNNVNTIIKDALVGESVLEQKAIDNKMLELDGTKSKSNLGANAILGVSMAVAKAGALVENKELYEYLSPYATYIPTPTMNVINGGVHADNNLDFQEYMIVPVNFLTFHEALRASSEVFHTLKKLLKQDGHATGVGDEGGFAPDLKDNEEGFKYLVKAIESAGYIPGKDFYLSIDAAASEFYDANNNIYIFKDGTKHTGEELIKYYEFLCNTYPLIFIEDAFSEDDWESWKLFSEKMNSKIINVGDDIFVTNSIILQKGIDLGIGNAILIKLNQIGTVSETIETINLAHNNNYKTIISHRSGETDDTFISDLSVAANSGLIKTGSLSRYERIAKYNRLLEIEDILQNGEYTGRKIFDDILQY